MSRQIAMFKAIEINNSKKGENRDGVKGEMMQIKTMNYIII